MFATSNTRIDDIAIELRQIEMEQRYIIRGCAYFGSHRGYLANETRQLKLLNELRGLRAA